jgi:CheY-like chemotaxis protein
MDPVRLRLLLVEDDEVDVLSVKRALKQRDLDPPLHVARDGQEALQMLREGKVSRDRLLVLLDLYMPRMSGIEFLQALRQDPELSRLPVVLLTTSQDEQVKLDAYQLNVAGFLRKPLDPTELAQQLAALCRFFSAVEMP